MASASSFHLRLHDPAQWQRHGPCWWRGYAWQQGEQVDPAQLALQATQWTTPAKVAAGLAELNGCFALVFDDPKLTWAAVDAARSVPLFWAWENGQLQLTDYLSPPTDPTDHLSPWRQSRWLSKLEYLPGDLTLHPAFRQLQAGEYLWASPDQRPQVWVHFDHTRPAPFEADEAELAAHFIDLMRGVTHRLATSAQGRPLVVLLSGGYDSRLLLATLHEWGYPQLSAITYGSPGSSEHRRARHITRQLGIPWTFVPYTPDLLQRFFEPPWQAYANYAANLSVLPQDQDYFALAQAHDTQVLPPDAIITPGYCGDVQAGSYVPGAYFTLASRRTTPALAQYLFHLLNPRLQPSDQHLLTPYLPQIPPGANHDSLVSALENWVLRERLSKYVVNGVRAYEFWGHSWRLPLWDHAFLRFWQRVPNHLRQDMYLYRHTLRQQWFEPMGIHFPEESAPPVPAWRSHLRGLLPAQVRKLWQQWRPGPPRPDVNGFDWLNHQLRDQLHWPPSGAHRTMNEMLGYWLHQHWDDPL